MPSTNKSTSQSASQSAAKYRAPQDLLTGKVILVTGAGDGIGAVAAKTYAAYGATVILTGKTIPKLEKVFDEIVEAKNPEPAIYPIDYTGASVDHYATMADTIEKNFGRLDGLLHNAAQLGLMTPLTSYTPEDWVKTLHTNLTAPFLLSQALIPLLQKAENASIIFTTDKVGQNPNAYWGAYGVSKAGIDNLMVTLAEELDNTTNIRVNSIDPGAIRTALRRNAYPGEVPTEVPLAEAIMPSYLYLMGKDSLDINKTTIAAQSK